MVTLTTRPNTTACLTAPGQSRARLLLPLVSVWLTALCFLALAPPARADSLTSLFSFSGPENGTNPQAALIQANDGNFYGTTVWGGADNYGTIYEMSPVGAVTTLYTFSYSDGANPAAVLMQGKDGNLYGTCSHGGANGGGTVFKIATGGVLTTLHSFNWSDGYYPYAALMQGKDGNLYGTTYEGGANDDGTVFQITTGGTFTSLYSFSAHSSSYPYTNSDGVSPYASLMQGTDGNLYGTTVEGGTNGTGTVFKFTTGGAFTSLYSFSGLSNGWYGTNSDGASPYASLIQGKDGNLYGTTAAGGANSAGTVFQIPTGGAFTSLYSFSATSSSYPYTNPDGAYPYAALIQGTDGNLYGTTMVGGEYGQGTIFALNLGLGAPILTSLNPNTTFAAGSGFDLFVQGSSFTRHSVVQWTQGTSTALKTTYFSSTLLRAAVPASLTANPGNAAVTVANAGVGVSNSQPFTIFLTGLKLLRGSITIPRGGTYVADVTLENVGHLSAPNVTISTASLGAATPTTTLPVSVGTIAAGATGSALLNFPASAGSPGSVVTLTVQAAFNGGSFSGSVQVKLP